MMGGTPSPSPATEPGSSEHIIIMWRQIFAAALAAGIIAGVLISGVQEFTTTPLILHAEEFEGSATAPNPSLARAVLDEDGSYFIPVHSGEDHEAWAPEDGLERSLFTAGTNILVGVGFALLLTAAYSLWGKPVDGRTGVIWGVAGFAIFTMAPSLGLPPEVPGSMAAELTARQGWWLAAAGATAFGLWAMVFGGSWLMRIAGILVLALPHLIGAPHPEAIGGNPPPELAGHFAAASIIVAGIFWAMLGWFSGTFYKRFQEAG